MTERHNRCGCYADLATDAAFKSAVFSWIEDAWEILDKGGDARVWAPPLRAAIAMSRDGGQAYAITAVAQATLDRINDAAVSRRRAPTPARRTASVHSTRRVA